jgi:hypothetical protein
MGQLNFKTWLVESFDSISEFLLNPEHKTKTWEQLLGEFKSSGGEELGNGQYGTTFSHPRWPYVLKMYQDPLYTGFVRFAYKNPHSAFPKFYGPPQRVTPHYKRHESQATTYLVRMEKLEPIDAATFKLIEDNNNMVTPYLRARETGTLGQTVPGRVEPSVRRQHRLARRQANADNQPEPPFPTAPEVNPFQQFMDAIKKKPSLLPLFEGMIALLNSGLRGAPDLKQDNFMKRKDGSLVYTDPFWEGSNPYKDAAAAFDRETDAYGDYDSGEPSLVGGELPKKRRKKRKKLRNPTLKTDNDVPF